jgi:hypothetical protein
LKTILSSVVILITCLAHSQTPNKQPDSFTVVAFGDMPYVLPEDYIRFERLIKTVNNQNQIFNVHVGDIKSSSTPCSEEYYQRIQNYFNQFNKPLVYTPGDNEWTDCNNSGGLL